MWQCKIYSLPLVKLLPLKEVKTSVSEILSFFPESSFREAGSIKEEIQENQCQWKKEVEWFLLYLYSHSRGSVHTLAVLEVKRQSRVKTTWTNGAEFWGKKSHCFFSPVEIISRAWGGKQCVENRQEKSGKWRMTAEALPPCSSSSGFCGHIAGGLSASF